MTNEPTSSSDVTPKLEPKESSPTSASPSPNGATELVVDKEADATPKISVPLRIWRMIVGGPSSQPQGQPVDGTREVIETVVFVVVLVLMLKSFVAEAFVIPTGSMAETLWGYQKIVTCPQCEFVFPVNVSTEVEPQEELRGETAPVRQCICPNCRKNIVMIPKGSSTTPDGETTIADPGWNTGDRVLVAKFIYDLLGKVPDRWDTVVFKFPGNNWGINPRTNWPNSGPQKNFVPMNYIKRLVGLPGETIAIYGGDLFASVHPDPTKYEKEDFKDCPDEASREKRRRLLWRRIYTHVGKYESHDADYEDMVEQLRAGTFRILRKPPEKILSMKRIVYDNDHQAKDLKDVLPPRWAGEDGGAWVKVGTGFQHDAKAADEYSWLHYQHILRGTPVDDPRPQLITDFTGYNAFVSETSAGQLYHPLPDQNWVGDLVLEAEVEVTGESGELIFELSQGVNRFQAQFDISNGSCQLFRIHNEVKEDKPLASVQTSLKGAGTYEVRFANVDRQLVVWVDGTTVFGEQGVAFEAPKQRGPTATNDLHPANIGCKGATMTVRHLRLWRDTYYTSNLENPRSTDATRSSAFADPNQWDDLRALPISTMYVQPDHFLCLGDNSAESSDGRSWGLVPRRLLLGKAVMVYYPFKFPWLSEVNRLGIIE